MMSISRNVILICILAILIIACTPAPASNVTSASATLISAQAQDTIVRQAATQNAIEANARLQDQYATVTAQAEQMHQAQQGQLSATAQAREDAIGIAMVEQARTNATASAQQQQAAVSSAWLQVTAQAQQIAATRIPFEATATKIAKDLQNAPTIADFDAILTEAIKLFAVLFIFSVGIVAIRKWQAKDIVQQPNADGPAFEVRHGLLKAPEPFVIWNPYEERFKYSLDLRDAPLQLPPPADEHGPIKVTDNSGAVSYIQPIGHAEARLRAYWKARVLRFLDSAIEISGPDSQKVPRFDKMKVKSSDWVETTDALGKFIYKEERQSTLCLPPYESLSLLRDAVASGQIIPLPRQTVLPNEGTQRETDNRETGQNSGKRPDNRENRIFTPSGHDSVALAGAVKNLPELFKKRSAA